jgi:uncharacterized protein YjiS (DUF1127 family)
MIRVSFETRSVRANSGGRTIQGHGIILRFAFDELRHNAQSQSGLDDRWETRRTMSIRSIISHWLVALILASCMTESALEPMATSTSPPTSPSIPSNSHARSFKTATKPLDLETARKSPSEFLEGPGRLMTIAQCTGCHSGALVRQYRSTRDGWQSLIRWMQKKQGLWALDPSIENEILDYLSTRYGRSADADDRRRPAIAEHLMPPREADDHDHESGLEKS